MHLKHKPLAHSKHSTSPTGFTVLTGCTGHTGDGGMEAGGACSPAECVHLQQKSLERTLLPALESPDPAENRVETITHPSLLWFYLELWKFLMLIYV